MIDGRAANEIFNDIRQHVTTGTLTAGETLPLVRGLTAELDVNRSTVVAAYRRLVTSGLAQSLGRNGTVIKGITAPVALESDSPDTPLIDLSDGNPAPIRPPGLSRYFAKINKNPHLYGNAAVSPGLKAQATQWVRDAMPGKGEINITNGTTDTVERLLCAHLLPDDSAVVENPCFLSSINMLRYAGFSVCPVSVDHGGMPPDILKLALRKGARAVILAPHAHNPTGCSLSASHTAQLQVILAHYPQVLAIVDDHFALLSAYRWYPAVTKETTHWAVIHSMSKTLGPDLCLAIVASGPVTSGKLHLRLDFSSQWVSHLLQDLACACLSNETYQRTLAQAQQFYAAQQRTLAAALRRYGIELPVGNGLSMWLPLEDNSQAIAFALAKSGWLVREGEVFGVNTPAYGLRITLSTLTDNDIDKLAADTH